ncbi:hypothetical protein AB0M43_33535 [Longispora sp. NPDC051575]|uniref:hypothetical protein n=1 Tax=Longispora sp. NPDC051575 TaxID=3154943 RepID=UPI00342C3211
MTLSGDAARARREQMRADHGSHIAAVVAAAPPWAEMPGTLARLRRIVRRPSGVGCDAR